MGFCADQLARVAPVWQRILEHEFLTATRDGTMPDATFATWIRQDYLFVEAAVPFLAAMIPRAPAHHVEPLTQSIAALYTELALFRERAQAAGIDLTDVEPAFVNHAYIQFLLASAYRESYAGAYTVLYAAEKAYHDSWKVVQRGIDPNSTWYPFVENWAGDAFAGYVAYLEGELDALAAQAGDADRTRMAALFELTARYELAFWEMALTGATWPGLGGTA